MGTRSTQLQRAMTTLRMVLLHALALAILTVPRMAPALAFAPRPLPPHRLYCSPHLARRTAAVASPKVLPHARRAERPIKKKPQGKRNLPANEAVAKRLIIENLERATPEEIIQLAFCVCLSE